MIRFALAVTRSRQRKWTVAHLLSSHRSRHTQAKDVALAFPAVCVWGANTGVGKTLISAGLVAAAVRNQVHVQFVKPVQTGYPEDSDARLVATVAEHTTGPTTAQQYLHGSSTLVAYSDPVSPHLAAAAEGRVVPDAEIVAGLAEQLQQFSATVQGLGASRSQGLSVVETAGGVTSPGPSGTLQGDLLRPLALPALLVGDPALGGISTTLSAYESLLLRGHTAAAVVMMTDERLNNVAAVKQHLRHAAAHRLGHQLPVLSLPLCQPPPTPTSTGLSSSPGVDPHLAAWLAASSQQFDALLQLLQQQHQQRLLWLQQAAGAAAATVWWPFTQHANLPTGEVTVVDSRAGENWLVYRQQSSSSSSDSKSSSSSSSSSSSGHSGPALSALHDAASSWWTQTAASSNLQLEVSRAVAAAAGRYMHVMWPQVAHAPGLELTRALLSGPLGSGWASRVFFSDDGSTAVEVALKMAFRKFMVDHKLLHQEDTTQLEVLALHNSYHGDTHGAMDCAASSPFNGRLQTPWYRGRGCFLQPPYLQLQQGQWRLQAPDWLQEGQGAGSSSSSWAWQSRQEAFDMYSRSGSKLAGRYEQHVSSAISSHEAAAGVRLGALLIEPVLQGAGGMLLVDPLFQKVLVQVARQRGIPVVYDEVFTGCWRLGVPTAGQLLGEAPDIACYAKLLTGGVAPLAVTLSTEAVFEAFKGPTKVEALLHGHSYTAYPLGCTAAMASLAVLTNYHMNPNVCTPEAPGRCLKSSASSAHCSCSQPCGQLLPLWDESAAAQLSSHKRVKGVVTLGSVLAVELAAVGPDGLPVAEGYGSSAAVDVVSALRARGVAARPLGPVVYLMPTPTTDREVCDWLLTQLQEVLDMEEGWGSSGSDGVIV